MNEKSRKKLRDAIAGLDLYEIYTYNSEKVPEGHGVYSGREAGTVSGWQIKWVYATDEGIKTFPFFDCVITKNDCPSNLVRDTAIIYK